ncbi:CGCGG family rSAM-modified RiPP protein [Bacillus sp. V3B]|nr:CGCGG family rSAM-modified RiPP protein [Bacillus sp. V3B]
MKKNRSVSFEHDEYEENVDLVVQDAIEEVENTLAGYYVNLVTPEGFGNPDEYLTEVLELHFKDTIRAQFIDQCGCGGYVLRVWKNK